MTRNTRIELNQLRREIDSLTNRVIKLELPRLEGDPTLFERILEIYRYLGVQRVEGLRKIQKP